MTSSKMSSAPDSSHSSRRPLQVPLFRREDAAGADHGLGDDRGDAVGPW
jgi:hypothetical protein